MNTATTSGAHRSEPGLYPGNVIDDLNPLGPIWNDRTTALIAASARVPEFSLPSTILYGFSTPAPANNHGNRWVFSTAHARQMGLSFYVRGADNVWFEASIRGWRRSHWTPGRPAGSPPDQVGKQFGPVWRPYEIGHIEGQGGAYLLTTDPDLREPLTQNGETNVRGVDSGQFDLDYTFGDTCRFVHEATAGVGAYFFDTMGCELIEIEAACTALHSGSAADSVNGFWFRV